MATGEPGERLRLHCGQAKGPGRVRVGMTDPLSVANASQGYGLALMLARVGARHPCQTTDDPATDRRNSPAGLACWAKTVDYLCCSAACRRSQPGFLLRRLWLGLPALIVPALAVRFDWYGY